MSNFKEMGIIAKSENLITLYCHPNHHLTTKCVAVAKASKAEVQIVEIDKTKVTGTEWAEIAAVLGIKVEDLIAKNHPAFLNRHEANVSLNDDDAIKLLQKEPEILAYPIGIRGKKVIQAKNSNDLLKLHKPDSKDAKLP